MLRTHTLCLALVTLFLGAMFASPMLQARADKSESGVDPFGACCLPNFGGCIETTESDCLNSDGVFQGPGSACDGFFCTGACCSLSGFCEELSEYDCFISEGTFLGGPCAIAKCEIPTGACCYANGTCIDDVDIGLCYEFNGAPGGIGSTCANTPCELAGSCCFDFGGGFTFCQGIMFESDCLNQGGTFNGPGSICLPDSCTPGTGACCLFPGGCVQVTPDGCDSKVGIYHGVGSICTPGLCCPADFNNDGTVNTPDLTYFLGRFGQNFLPPGSEPADLVPDGTVNTLDLTRFLAAFGKVCPY